MYQMDDNCILMLAAVLWTDGGKGSGWTKGHWIVGVPRVYSVQHQKLPKCKDCLSLCKVYDAANENFFSIFKTHFYVYSLKAFNIKVQ